MTTPKIKTAIANVQKIRCREVNGPSDRSGILLTPEKRAASARQLACRLAASLLLYQRSVWTMASSGLRPPARLAHVSASGFSG